jgi:hypothetical protein
VPKGEFGGDLIQRVVGPAGQICGSILWEAKRTKNFAGPRAGCALATQRRAGVRSSATKQLKSEIPNRTESGFSRGEPGMSRAGRVGFTALAGAFVVAGFGVAAYAQQTQYFATARIVKFSKDGKFIKAWGHKGAAPGDFDEPHDIFIGGSQQRVYVADRRNSRIQVFDQDGNFIVAWKQFGQPSSVFVGKDDTIYVGASFKDPTAKNKLAELRGIVIGNAKDGSLTGFIPDPSDLNKVDVGTWASGIAADDMGSIFAVDVGTHNLRKYVKVR